MADQSTSSPAGDLASSLAQVSDLLSRDRFTSTWEVTAEGVVFRVGVGDTDCADCLVPRTVLEVMLGNALQDTGHTIARVEMPGDPA